MRRKQSGKDFAVNEHYWDEIEATGQPERHEPAPATGAGKLTEMDYTDLGFNPSLKADADSAGIEELEAAAELYDELVAEKDRQEFEALQHLKPR